MSAAVSVLGTHRALGFDLDRVLVGLGAGLQAFGGHEGVGDAGGAGGDGHNLRQSRVTQLVAAASGALVLVRVRSAWRITASASRMAATVPTSSRDLPAKRWVC